MCSFCFSSFLLLYALENSTLWQTRWKLKSLSRTRICQEVSLTSYDSQENGNSGIGTVEQAVRGCSYLYILHDRCILTLRLRPSEPTDRNFPPEDEPMSCLLSFPALHKMFYSTNVLNKIEKFSTSKIDYG